jgi:hypothetical protein
MVYLLLVFGFDIHKPPEEKNETKRRHIDRLTTKSITFIRLKINMWGNEWQRKYKKRWERIKILAIS